MAAGLATRTDFMRARGQHQACRLFVHLTWHTYHNERTIRGSAVSIITDSMKQAGQRARSVVLAQAVLSDHIHLLIQCAPDATVSTFVREAKSESSRRVGKTLRWQRGYFADSVSRSHVIGVRRYLAAQFDRHPDKIPPG